MHKFRNSLILFGGLVALLGAIALATSTKGHARVNDNGDGDGQFGPPIVGLWKVVLTQNGNEILRGFETYHSDHTEVLVEVHDPRTGNVCQGTWTEVGPRTYKLLHPTFRWNHLVDESLIQPPLLNQNWVGYRIGNVIVTVDPSGNSFTGTWTVRRFSTTGVFQGEVDAQITGQRITPNTPESDLF